MQTVAATYLRSFFDTCVHLGCDPVRLSAAFGGNPVRLNMPTERIPATDAVAMLELAARELGTDSVGLRAGENIRPQTLLDLGYGVIACATVREAMDFNAKYQPVNQQLGQTKIVVGNGYGRIQWTPFRADAEYMRLATEAVFSGYANIGKWLTWVFDEPIIGMSFRHKRAADLSVYDEIFGCPVTFEAEIDEMWFDASVVDRHLPQSNPGLVATLAARLDQQLQELGLPRNLERDIYLYLQHELTNGPPPIGHVAQTMSIPERTLRRRLKQAGTSYRDILEAARRDTCEVYLKERGRTVAEIAQLLGYSEQSAFTRAFRGWFGAPPSRYLAG